MISAATIERFRGLRYLEVQGFGRVNLVIGKNDCGKTALLEALLTTAPRGHAGQSLLVFQWLRNPKVPPVDFERYWQPLFWGQDATQGLSIETDCAGSTRRVELRASEAPAGLVPNGPLKPDAVASSWAMTLRTTTGGQVHEERIHATSAGLSLPVATHLTGWAWVSPGKNLNAEDVRSFSKLKQTGRESDLVDVLREVDPRVGAIELLAPSGAEAELFVRLAAHGPLLPIAMMGDGFQRCFEIAVVATGGSSTKLFIDEIDNGLHHSILEPVWRWLAMISAKRDIQVFATTHSEECIQAACRAFTALNDDGLRVIRLDRRGEDTVATVYDRALVEAATEMGVEIRG